ncbi:hypothetical protein J6590_097547 [Homalodisca vitripennis]|nr:hypothetical protein J6590_097547 [Homalodisca vitripennis]
MEAKTDVTTSSSYDCRISSSSYEFWKPRETSRPALAMIDASQVHPMNSGSQERPLAMIDASQVHPMNSGSQERPKRDVTTSSSYDCRVSSSSCLKAKRDGITSSSCDCWISSSSYGVWKPRQTSRPALAMIAASQVHPMNSGSQERRHDQL